jgi:hypothetical protein
MKSGSVNSNSTYLISRSTHLLQIKSVPVETNLVRKLITYSTKLNLTFLFLSCVVKRTPYVNMFEIEVVGYMEINVTYTCNIVMFHTVLQF